MTPQIRRGSRPWSEWVRDLADQFEPGSEAVARLNELADTLLPVDARLTPARGTPRPGRGVVKPLSWLTHHLSDHHQSGVLNDDEMNAVKASHRCLKNAIGGILEMYPEVTDDRREA